jgi:hypothetical protein
MFINTCYNTIVNLNDYGIIQIETSTQAIPCSVIKQRQGEPFWYITATNEYSKVFFGAYEKIDDADYAMSLIKDSIKHGSNLYEMSDCDLALDGTPWDDENDDEEDE